MRRRFVAGRCRGARALQRACGLGVSRSLTHRGCAADVRVASRLRSGVSRGVAVRAPRGGFAARSCVGWRRRRARLRRRGARRARARSGRCRVDRARLGALAEQRAAVAIERRAGAALRTEVRARAREAFVAVRRRCRGVVGVGVRWRSFEFAQQWIPPALELRPLGVERVVTFGAAVRTRARRSAHGHDVGRRMLGRTRRRRFARRFGAGRSALVRTRARRSAHRFGAGRSALVRTRARPSAQRFDVGGCTFVRTRRSRGRRVRRLCARRGRRVAAQHRLQLRVRFGRVDVVARRRRGRARCPPRRLGRERLRQRFGELAVRFVGWRRVGVAHLRPRGGVVGEWFGERRGERAPVVGPLACAPFARRVDGGPARWIAPAPARPFPFALPVLASLIARRRLRRAPRRRVRVRCCGRTGVGSALRLHPHRGADDRGRADLDFDFVRRFGRLFARQCLARFRVDARFDFAFLDDVLREQLPAHRHRLAVHHQLCRAHSPHTLVALFRPHPRRPSLVRRRPLPQCRLRCVRRAPGVHRRLSAGFDERRVRESLPKRSDLFHLFRARSRGP